MRFLIGIAATALIATSAPTRIVDRIADKVRKALPQANVTMSDAHAFVVRMPKRDDVQISVERIEDFCAVNTVADCDAQIATFADSIVAMATTDYTITNARLRVIIRTRADADGYAATFPQADRRPLMRAMPEGLFAVLAADFPQGTRLVSSQDLRVLGLSLDEAFALARGR